MQTEGRNRIDAVGTTAILMAVLCWASGPLFIRYLTGHLDAWSQNLWRYAVAFIFWLPFLFISIRKGTAGPTAFKRAIFPSIVNLVMQSCWAWTFYFIEPGFGTLVSRSSMIWIMGFSLIYFANERPLVRSFQFWAGMLFTGAGLVAVVVSREGFTSRSSLIGIATMLSASVAWAAYTILARIFFKDIDSRIGFSIVSLYTMIGLGVMAVILGKPSQILTLPPWPWACVIISGVLSIALAHTFYYVSLRRIGTMIPAVVLQMSPFATIVLSMIVFAERLNGWQWTGGAVLVAGSILAILAQQHLKRGGDREEQITLTFRG